MCESVTERKREGEKSTKRSVETTLTANSTPSLLSLFCAGEEIGDAQVCLSIFTCVCMALDNLHNDNENKDLSAAAAEK